MGKTLHRSVLLYFAISFCWFRWMINLGLTLILIIADFMLKSFPSVVYICSCLSTEKFEDDFQINSQLFNIVFQVT